jgi:glycerophosphoryl diester phosphodiesterase
MMTPTGLSEIATYARGVGVYKNLIIPRDRDERLLAPTHLVEDAHRLGLLVHVWTFRSENNFLPLNLRRGQQTSPNFLSLHGDAIAEYGLFFRLKVDGVFTDYPGDAVAARKGYK